MRAKPKFTQADSRKGQRDWAAACKGIFGKDNDGPMEPVRRPLRTNELRRDSEAEIKKLIAQTRDIIGARKVTLNKELKPKKTAVQLPKRTEADVLADIKRMAKYHPKVAAVRRSNSGQMTGIHNGKKRFVTFNTVQKANRSFTDSRDIRISDIELVLHGGKTLSIECKAPGFIEPNWVVVELQEFGLISEENARLLGQRRYLQMMIDAGNYGIFASDVNQVLDALERAA